MLNIDSVETVYLACGITDLRKSIDGLVMIVQNQLKLDPFDKALFVFCNKKMEQSYDCSNIHLNNWRHKANYSRIKAKPLSPYSAYNGSLGICSNGVNS